MDAFRLVLTVVVMVGVVVAILLFERRRADRIARDTRDMARGTPPPDDDDV
ncbi:hypothetical protein ACS3YM_00900 [Nocardia sp. N13]|jgi:uncharacterized membrane protein affecting hemolysin expression|uniref:hypothetical protein n=1 Tax=Nocardioides sp. N13(2025) TaxID=3453405 RepID=UPI003F769238